MVAIQIDGTTANLGLDPELPHTWSSSDAALAARLNEDAPHYRGYNPDPQYAEAEAVVKQAVANGQRASITLVDQVEEPEDETEVVY